MLSDYRAWLASQISTDGDGAMAKRALERLDSDLRGTLPLTLDAAKGNRILNALEMLEQTQTHLDPALSEFRQMLRDAMRQKSSGDVIGTPSTE